MRAYELFNNLKLDEGDLIPLPQWTLRIVGYEYEMYQISKMLANPNLSHKIDFQYRYNDWGDAGANHNDVVFTFTDPISFEEAKKVLSHYGIEYLTGESACKPLGADHGRFTSTITPPSQSDNHYADLNVSANMCDAQETAEYPIQDVRSVSDTLRKLSNQD